MRSTLGGLGNANPAHLPRAMSGPQLFYFSCWGVSTWPAPAGLSAIRPVAAQPHTRGQAAAGHPNSPWLAPQPHTHANLLRVWTQLATRRRRPRLPSPTCRQRPRLAAPHCGRCERWGPCRHCPGGRRRRRRPRRRRRARDRPASSARPVAADAVSWRVGVCVCGRLSRSHRFPPAHTRCEWGLIGLVCGRPPRGAADPTPPPPGSRMGHRWPWAHPPPHGPGVLHTSPLVGPQRGGRQKGVAVNPIYNGAVDRSASFHRPRPSAIVALDGATSVPRRLNARPSIACRPPESGLSCLPSTT